MHLKFAGGAIWGKAIELIMTKKGFRGKPGQVKFNSFF